MQKDIRVDRQRGDALIYSIGVVVLLIAGLVVWRVTTTHMNHATSATTTSSLTKSTVPPMSTGTNNSDLQTDLNSVNGSITQEQQDANSADAAVNDQQNQVVVPAN